MTTIKNGVLPFASSEVKHAGEWISVKVEDLRILNGYYFEGPAMVRLDVSGQNSSASVDLTPEAARSLIDALRSILTNGEP